MTDTQRDRSATDAIPYPVRVGAAFSWRVLMIATLFAAVGYALVTLRVVAVPVAVALLLTALLGPVVNWMTQRYVPRALATTIVMIGGLALIAGLLAFVIQAFVSGLPSLRTEVAGSVEEIKGWLQHPPFGLPPVNLENLLNSAGNALAGDGGSTITAGAVSTAFTVGEIFTGIALTLFTLIYLLYGGRSIWLFVIRPVPSTVRARVDLAGRRSFASLVGFVRATVLVAVVDALGIGIGLLAVGAPLVVPLTALVFLAAFIPVVGAVLSGVVAVLVVLVSKGLVSALVVLGVVIGVQQLEGNLLQPLLLGRAVALNGLAVVLAVTIGSVTAGITGALLAVPTLAVLNAGIRSLLNDEDKAEAKRVGSPDASVSAEPGDLPARPGGAREAGPSAGQPGHHERGTGGVLPSGLVDPLIRRTGETGEPAGSDGATAAAGAEGSNGANPGDGAGSPNGAHGPEGPDRSGDDAGDDAEVKQGSALPPADVPMTPSAEQPGGGGSHRPARKRRSSTRAKRPSEGS